MRVKTNNNIMPPPPSKRRSERVDEESKKLKTGVFTRKKKRYITMYALSDL